MYIICITRREKLCISEICKRYVACFTVRRKNESNMKTCQIAIEKAKACINTQTKHTYEYTEIDMKQESFVLANVCR